MSYGRVIGGHYLDATVTTAPIGSGLVVQAGLKWKKLNDAQVLEWVEIVSEAKPGAVSAVGQAVAGAVLPRFLSKSGTAAVGAALDARRPPRTVRVNWADGKQSLIKLPDTLFTHFALMLENRRAEPVAAVSTDRTTSADLDIAPKTPPTLAEQALGHLRVS